MVVLTAVVTAIDTGIVQQHLLSAFALSLLAIACIASMLIFPFAIFTLVLSGTNEIHQKARRRLLIAEVLNVLVHLFAIVPAIQ